MQQKKIGLAISGGAARGAAAIGVLRVLEEAGVRPACIAGTSVGAVVGGLYACGISIGVLEQLFCAQSWGGVFRGRRLKDQIELLAGQYADVSFDTLPIPFRCVATELSSCSERILSKGSLPEALRASMAMPGLFGTISFDGEQLADGGMVNNLPTDVVRQMGADVVIAVDLQQITFWRTSFSLRDRLGIGGIMHWAVSHPEVGRYHENVRQADIYLRPPLTALDGYLFSRSRSLRMVRKGEEEARRHLADLRSIIAAQP